MLSETPVIAAAAGGAVELITHGQTGFLTPPGEAQKLAEVINNICHTQPQNLTNLVREAKNNALKKFDLSVVNLQISRLLSEAVEAPKKR